MAKRKEQYLKQKIATMGNNSTKFTRRMKALAIKIQLARARDMASNSN
jgi:hypothetical protein